MIAGSLKFGSGFRLIKLAKLVVCMQNHYKLGCMATDEPGHGSVLLSHSENVVMRIG